MVITCPHYSSTITDAAARGNHPVYFAADNKLFARVRACLPFVKFQHHDDNTYSIPGRAWLIITCCSYSIRKMANIFLMGSPAKTSVLPESAAACLEALFEAEMEDKVFTEISAWLEYTKIHLKPQLMGECASIFEVTASDIYEHEPLGAEADLTGFEWQENFRHDKLMDGDGIPIGYSMFYAVGDTFKKEDYMLRNKDFRYGIKAIRSMLAQYRVDIEAANADDDPVVASLIAIFFMSARPLAGATFPLPGGTTDLQTVLTYMHEIILLQYGSSDERRVTTRQCIHSILSTQRVSVMQVTEGVDANLRPAMVEGCADPDVDSVDRDTSGGGVPKVVTNKVVVGLSYRLLRDYIQQDTKEKTAELLALLMGSTMDTVEITPLSLQLAEDKLTTYTGLLEKMKRDGDPAMRMVTEIMTAEERQAELRKLAMKGPAIPARPKGVGAADDDDEEARPTSGYSSAAMSVVEKEIATTVFIATAAHIIKMKGVELDANWPIKVCKYITVFSEGEMEEVEGQKPRRVPEVHPLILQVFWRGTKMTSQHHEVFPVILEARERRDAFLARYLYFGDSLGESSIDMTLRTTLLPKPFYKKFWKGKFDEIDWWNELMLPIHNAINHKSHPAQPGLAMTPTRMQRYLRFLPRLAMCMKVSPDGEFALDSLLHSIEDLQLSAERLTGPAHQSMQIKLNEIFILGMTAGGEHVIRPLLSDDPTRRPRHSFLPPTATELSEKIERCNTTATHFAEMYEMFPQAFKSDTHPHDNTSMRDVDQWSPQGVCLSSRVGHNH